MDQIINNLGFILSALGVIIFIGSFYGTTSKRLTEIEENLKSADEYKNSIIDKLARIETKLDFLTRNKQ